MIRALIAKEILELKFSSGPVSLLLAVSIMVFLLTSQFISNNGKLAVSMMPNSCVSNSTMRSLLDEQPELEFRRETIAPSESHWDMMDRAHLSMLFVCDQHHDNELWTAYASLRNHIEQTKADFVQQLLYQSLKAGRPWYLNRIETQGERVAPSAEGIDGHTTNTAPVRHDDWHLTLQIRGGSSRVGSIWLMPGMGLLLGILLTFYLASTVVSKEVGRETWHLFRLSSKSNSLRVVVGKLFLPLTLGMLSLILYVVLGTLFDVEVKQELGLLTLLFFIPALLTSAMQGLFVSCLLRNEAGGVLAGAAYLIGMIMLSGIIVPHEESGGAIQFVGAAFPLTHAVSVTQAVALHGASALSYWNEFIQLSALLVISTVAAFLAVGQSLARY